MPDISIFTSVINSYLPEPHASLLNGIIFGTSVKTAQNLYNNLKIVGLLHLVVLSGMNITLLAAVVAAVFDRWGKKISLIISIVTIIVFINFVGIQAPVIRAGIMGILSLLAVVFGRKAAAFYLLILTATIMILIWPAWIGTISFQLSFGATLGIILLAKTKTKKPKKILAKLKYSFIKELRTSLAAQVLTVPIIFLYFRQVSFISPIANVLVAFTIAPLMVFGLLTAILGKINFILGLPTAYICYGMISYILIVVDWLSKIPGAMINF